MRCTARLQGNKSGPASGLRPGPWGMACGAPQGGSQCNPSRHRDSAHQPETRPRAGQGRTGVLLFLYPHPGPCGPPARPLPTRGRGLNLPRLLLAAAVAGLFALPAAADPGTDFFEKKIRPALAEHCLKCHSAEAAKAKKLKGGLLLDSRDGLRKGGDSGPAVVPGKPADSLLVKALKYD